MHIIEGGNRKLGKSIAVINRPTVTTCPSTCPLMDRGCYAQKLENLRPNVTKSAMRNLFADSEVRNLKKTKAVRLHVNGDFYREDRLDRKYLAAMVLSVQKLHRQGKPSWTYTHCWRDPVLTRILNRLKRFGLTVFASVHSTEEAREAAALGYRVAFVSTLRAKDLQSRAQALQPLVDAGIKGIVCPEQLGTGLTCSDCGYCYNGKSRNSLVLLRH